MTESLCWSVFEYISVVESGLFSRRLLLLCGFYNFRWKCWQMLTPYLKLKKNTKTLHTHSRKQCKALLVVFLCSVRVKPVNGMLIDGAVFLWFPVCWHLSPPKSSQGSPWGVRGQQRGGACGRGVRRLWGTVSGGTQEQRGVTVGSRTQWHHASLQRPLHLSVALVPLPVCNCQHRS